MVPEPIEKCAVCAASPMSTTGTERPSTSMRCVQRSHTTRGKRIQLAEPRRCVALLMSECPPRYLANSFSQKAMASGCSIWSRPWAFHTASGVSTMKVEVLSSNW
ncbi:hypothetical protein D3C72_1428180 [compost metagenome]